MQYRAFTATTTPQQCVPYNPKRVGLIVRSNSAQQVFLSGDPTAVTTQGFFLNQNDALTLQAFMGDDPREPVFCQTAALTTDLRIVESFGVYP